MAISSRTNLLTKTSALCLWIYRYWFITKLKAITILSIKFFRLNLISITIVNFSFPAEYDLMRKVLVSFAWNLSRRIIDHLCLYLRHLIKMQCYFCPCRQVIWSDPTPHETPIPHCSLHKSDYVETISWNEAYQGDKIVLRHAKLQVN